MQLIIKLTTSCNLKCSYCYITQSNLWNLETQNINNSPQYVIKETINITEEQGEKDEKNK